MWEENKKDRIRRRSEQYAKGELSLDDFILLESIDQDEEDHCEKKLSLTELDEMKRAEEELREAKEEEQIPKPVFSISKEEFDELPLYEQMKIYEEHPDEITKLLKPVKRSSITLTREEFRERSLADQNKYYLEKPEEIRALLEGTVDSVEVRDQYE